MVVKEDIKINEDDLVKLVDIKVEDLIKELVVNDNVMENLIHENHNIKVSKTFITKKVNSYDDNEEVDY